MFLGKKSSYPAGQTMWSDLIERLLGEGEALRIHRDRSTVSPGSQVSLAPDDIATD